MRKSIALITISFVFRKLKCGNIAHQKPFEEQSEKMLHQVSDSSFNHLLSQGKRLTAFGVD